jgi:hypothetical protein
MPPGPKKQKVHSLTNRVLRGTAQYFATRWSTGRKQFRLLDRWVRMRLRAMKFKRKWQTDNYRMRLKDFARLGLLSLESFLPPPAGA